MLAFISLLVGLAAFRLFPHPENFAPLGAFAFMGGLYLGKRYALAVPLLALAFSDLVLNAQAGYPLLHLPRLVDYTAFALIALGALALRNTGWKPKLAAAIATPFFFFALSNFGVWMTGLDIAGLPYPKTATGLASCYAAGIPFLRGSLLGDWGFMALFAAVMTFAQHSAKQPVAATR